MADVEGRWFLAAIVMFALPILDTALAFARRYVNGRPLSVADKSFSSPAGRSRIYRTSER